MTDYRTIQGRNNVVPLIIFQEIDWHSENVRYLWQKRDQIPTIPNPGKWTSFGGFKEADESALEAAARECREELGWGLHLNSFIPFATYIERNDADQQVHVLSFRIGETPPKITLGEGAGYGFFLPSETRLLNLSDNALNIFEDVEKARPYLV